VNVEYDLGSVTRQAALNRLVGPIIAHAVPPPDVRGQREIRERNRL
jgi:hypothetical protein